MDSQENGRRMAAAWIAAEPALEKLRWKEIREANTQNFVTETTGIMDDLELQWPMRLSSGLEEQQALFRKKTK